MPTEQQEYERKLEDVARAIDPTAELPDAADRARNALSVLGIHPPLPPWPTQEMIDVFKEEFDAKAKVFPPITDYEIGQCIQKMYLVDPHRKVVRAAVVYRNMSGAHADSSAGQRVMDTVNEMEGLNNADE